MLGETAAAQAGGNDDHEAGAPVEGPPVQPRPTVVLGVAGRPEVVANSLSPTMFAAAFSALGWDRSHYVPLAIRDRAIRKGLRSLPRLGFSGVNVTMPYKGAAAEVAHTRSALVEQTGVANTLVIGDDGQVHAEATDGIGITESLAAAGVSVDGEDVLVLGAGGAATEAAFACAAAGAARIRVWNRSPGRARELLDRLAAAYPALRLQLCDALPIGDPAHVLVSAVPGDALPQGELARVRAGALVVDLAYRHDRQPTPLIRATRDRGGKHVDGREVLVRQGAASFRLWFDVAPPLEVMMRAVA